MRRPSVAEGTNFILERTPTPLGEVVLVSDPDGALRLFYWEDPTHRWKAALTQRYGNVALIEKKNPFGHAKVLKAYFAGDIAAVDALKVAFAGTPFQLKVWNALRKIAGGTTTSYGALAKKIGKPDAVRAVGLANGSNPISIVIPCHRVVNKDGKLGGYGGGLWRKQHLLALEKHALTSRRELET